MFVRVVKAVDEVDVCTEFQMSLSLGGGCSVVVTPSRAQGLSGLRLQWPL